MDGPNEKPDKAGEQGPEQRADVTVVATPRQGLTTFQIILITAFLTLFVVGWGASLFWIQDYYVDRVAGAEDRAAMAEAVLRNERRGREAEIAARVAAVEEKADKRVKYARGQVEQARREGREGYRREIEEAMRGRPSYEDLQKDLLVTRQRLQMAYECEGKLQECRGQATVRAVAAAEARAAKLKEGLDAEREIAESRLKRAERAEQKIEELEDAVEGLQRRIRGDTETLQERRRRRVKEKGGG